MGGLIAILGVLKDMDQVHRDFMHLIGTVKLLFLRRISTPGIFLRLSMFSYSQSESLSH